MVTLSRLSSPASVPSRAINGTVAGVHDALINAGLDEGDIDRVVDRPDPNMIGGGLGG
jgi:hypothetical protein